MKPALQTTLVLAVLVGFALPGLSQGSMSRFTASAQNAIGSGKTFASSSTNGFTISAQRDFDRSVAITVSATTRFWFLETPVPSQSLVAAGRYENAALWAQASRASPGLALAGSSQSLTTYTHSGLVSTRNLEYGPASRIDAELSQYDDGQLAAWIQRNIRFANVDPMPR